MICVQAWRNYSIHGLKLESKATKYTPSNTRHKIDYISNNDILYYRRSTSKNINHFLDTVILVVESSLQVGCSTTSSHRGSKPLSFKPFIKPVRFSELLFKADNLSSISARDDLHVSRSFFYFPNWGPIFDSSFFNSSFNTSLSKCWIVIVIHSYVFDIDVNCFSVAISLDETSYKSVISACILVCNEAMQLNNLSSCF